MFTLFNSYMLVCTIELTWFSTFRHFVDIFYMYSICFITMSLHQRLRGYNAVSLLDFQYCINIFLYIHICIVISNIYHCLYLEIYTSLYSIIYHPFVYIVHMFCLWAVRLTEINELVRARNLNQFLSPSHGSFAVTSRLGLVGREKPPLSPALTRQKHRFYIERRQISLSDHSFTCISQMKIFWQVILKITAKTCITLPLVLPTSGPIPRVLGCGLTSHSGTHLSTFFCILINNENTSSGKLCQTLVKKQCFCPVRAGWQWWLLCQPIQAMTSRRAFLYGWILNII